MILKLQISRYLIMTGRKKPQNAYIPVTKKSSN